MAGRTCSPGRARVFDSEAALIEALDHRARTVRGPRHGGDPLRGSARGAGHARAPRSHVADHRAVPPARHHHCAHDRRTLLRRIGGTGHRARLPGGGARGADRAYRGRRHHRRRRRRATPSTARSWRTPRRSRPGGRGGRPRPTATVERIRWCGPPARDCSGGCAPARCPRSRAPGCQTPVPGSTG